jgi:DMSO/TMAO reductase YedYZ molybdopterin-dependent catalytic subunit
VVSLAKTWLIAVLIAVLGVGIGAGIGIGNGIWGGEATTTPESPPVTTVLTVVKGDQTVNVTLDEIKAMTSYEGWGGRLTTAPSVEGPFLYKGALLEEICDLVGGITPTDSVEIIAKDGYSMTYTYEQAMGGGFIMFDPDTFDPDTGTITELGESTTDDLTVILAYEEDGESLPEQYGGPLRLCIVDSADQITRGHWSIKWVTQIEIQAAEAEWTLHLEGAISEDIDSATFESGAAPGCHGVTWTCESENEWTGIPLWLLVGRVDDDVIHYTSGDAFNDDLADSGAYVVRVIAADGYYYDFNSTFVAGNDNIIVAYRMNDEPLSEDYYPLKLVGSALTSGKQKVSQIVSIELIWTLHLEGALSDDVNQTEFEAMATTQGVIYTSIELDDWSGIPLWALVGLVDDEDPGTFNDTLANSGAYQVKVIACDGYSHTFEDSSLVAYNDDIIIASMVNDEIPEDSWPLRLVGDGFPTSKWVRMVVEIQLIFI